MKNAFEQYDNGFRIVSLAKDEATAIDLKNNCLDYLYLIDGKVFLFPDVLELKAGESLLEELIKGNNYDVFQIFENGRIIKIYDDASIDNYFFISGKCNSNCLMCPTASVLRKRGENVDVNLLIEVAKHIPSDTVHLTLTGGEPFMVGENIFCFIKFLREKFENTTFLILTNGRVFSIEKYVLKLKNELPNNCILGIPLHGSSPQKHDMITQTVGSFSQTLIGIKNLLAQEIRVELRWVACALNVSDFENMAKLVINEISDIEYISIMATEMTGSAFENKEKVWMPYRKVFEALETAILMLIENGIDVKLYNFPICTVKKRFWALCEKSISPDKVRYAEVCETCKMKKSCGGVFSGTFLLEKDELDAIL